MSERVLHATSYSSGLERAIEIATEQSAHVKDNSYRLLQFDDAKQEARCRQLASMYIDEFIWLLRSELSDVLKGSVVAS